MKKIFGLILIMSILLSVSACGGSRDSKLAGKYIAVSAKAMGMTLNGDDVKGFSFDLKSNGKAIMDIEGSSTEGKWVSDEKTVTITIEGTDMVGKLGEDTLIFESILEEIVGESMDVTFAKEGSEAAKPENNLTEEEKALVGEWTGVSVADVSDADVSGEVSPDSMKATLTGDHKATITYKGEVIATPDWHYYSEMINFEGDVKDKASLYGEYKEGKFIIIYSQDNYYKFTMGSRK